MKKLYLLLASLLLSLLTFSQTATEPTSGAGNETDPYEIQSLENLYWISQNSAFWDAHYIQTADIDAAETETWFDGEGFSPIGNETTPFTGSYDGDNHSISNLYINRDADYIGLFGYVGTSTVSGTLKNINLDNADINCAAENTWIGAGALAGSIYGQIDNCHSSGAVNGDVGAGGLIGAFEIGNVTNSSSSCSVTGIDVIGGFIGWGDNVQNCFSTGDVSGPVGDIYGATWVGGFAGYTDAEINNCYSTGNVTGTSMLGGFVGEVRLTSGSAPIISNCYAWGNVTSPSASANGDIAAFAGECDDNGNAAVEILYSYAIGSVVYESASNPTDKGFVGSDVGTNTYTDNFFNSSTSGQTSGIGATMQITSGMKTGSTFTDAGWDFMGETTNGENDYWGINQNENSGYPFLKWQGYKLRADVSEWPNVSVVECGEALIAAELTGGSASVAGTFSFVEPDHVPPLGTSQQQLQFVPDDTETYEKLFQQTEVSVEDTQAPIPVESQLTAVTAECEINELSAPTATDACAGEVVGTHDISLPITTQGTYTVTWTYDDGNGNVETQIQSLVVEDTTTPTITCPADQSIDLVSEESVYTVSGTEFDPTGTSDNCEVASIENDFNNTETLAGEELPEGTTTIVWTVSDNAGNENACSFELTVNAYVGISDMANEILIYPNPTSGLFSFYATQKINVMITDINGRVLKEFKHENERSEIDISDFANGLYFVKVFNNEKLLTFKITKQ